MICHRCIGESDKLSDCSPIFKSALQPLQKSHSSLTGLCHVIGLYHVLKCATSLLTSWWNSVSQYFMFWFVFRWVLLAFVFVGWPFSSPLYCWAFQFLLSTYSCGRASKIIEAEGKCFSEFPTSRFSPGRSWSRLSSLLGYLKGAETFTLLYRPR